MSYAASAAEVGSARIFPLGAQRHDGSFDPGLELPEALVDAAPARRDEIDEDREVVDPRIALREERLLEPFEAAKRLVHPAADLGEAARDRNDLARDAVAHRRRDLLRQRRLEIVCDLRETHHLGPRSLERRVEPCPGDAFRPRLGDPVPCPFECLFVHGAKATLAVG